ncbi:hypothetical protein GGR39_003007 [Novosphingobium fluoreni]|uniref:Uncharacterized protein n=1 Tax=Novosphingobium fluoreni TaxID=1391222 RepID=A0A7W6C0P1_9SPHN|nr:hypothetical protein [Novosphingobium fluoreni]MBB3941331.1 hypothetical protein [Novosphingobium fluoreni]
MTIIDQIIERRSQQSRWDPALWDFTERVQCLPKEKWNDRSVEPRPLQHVSDDALQARLEGINSNIQYLDDPDGPRDDWQPEKGWLSPWWWLRLRHWTLSEFKRRGLAVQLTREIPPGPRLQDEFLGIHAGASPKLFRLSRIPYLMKALEQGQLRFAPALGYKAMENDEARADDEMSKGYKRAGNRVTITTLDGRPIKALSDVSFDTRRMTADMVDLPYWMLCASTDFDPRLFDEFPGGQGDDGMLAIFDPVEFRRRAGMKIASALPHVHLAGTVVEYFDVYHPESGDISPVTMKAMRFAYQREHRLVLDPGHGPAIAAKDYFIDIGSIEDIAGVYGVDGRKLAGTGPDSFLA